MQRWFNICKPSSIIQHINRSKDKNHMILSIDEGKAFDKIQHFLMVRALAKLGIEGMYLNIMKGISDTPIAIIILNGEKNETISPKVRNKTKVSILSTLIQPSLGILSQRNKTERRNERNSNRKERSQAIPIWR
jgi:hypothetical protein